MTSLLSLSELLWKKRKYTVLYVYGVLLVLEFAPMQYDEIVARNGSDNRGL